MIRFCLTVVSLFVMLFAVQTHAQREYINGRVTRVSDGDTCVIETEDGDRKIRFFGVDTPESDQPFGAEAARYTRDELMGELVTVLVVAEDQYGRIVGEIFVNGASVNRGLAAEGLAWWYKHYAPDDYDIARLVDTARSDGRGLWSEPDPIAPWDWRRGERPDRPETDLNRTTASIDSFDGLGGNALVRSIREEYAPDRTFSYRRARELMFSVVEADENGVLLAYTGDSFVTAGIPDHTVVNTEHTWPQSRFGHAGGDMKSDIHHLFPVYSKVNSSRGNEAFVEVPDQDTNDWWGGPESQEHIPQPSERDRFSERGPQGFEPREAHKGNVARAMFYFYTIYGDRGGVDLAWFRSQVPTLQEWHDADPVDDRERLRSQRIGQHQGNENPFVLDEDLLDRVAATLN